MEKNSPHYPLQDIKADVAARGADAFTRTALHGMGEMGLSLNEAVNMVLGLNRRRMCTTPPVLMERWPTSRSRFRLALP